MIIQSILVGGALYGLFIYQGQLTEARRSNELLRVSTDAATKAATVAEDSVNQARDNARLDQRAWVTPSGAVLEKALVANARPTVIIEIMNSGKTPALNTRVTGSVYIASQPRPELRPLGPSNKQSMIGPGDNISVMPEANDPITEDQISAIRKGELYLFAKGSVTYTDIFQQPHKTTFCFATEGRFLEKLTMRHCESATAD